MSYNAYAAQQQATESPRDLEIRAITFVTKNLVDATRPDVAPLDRIRALNGNLKLWSLLTNDLLNPDNGLPEAIKTSYLRLGKFAKRASTEALLRPSDLSLLIQINTDLLDALNYQARVQAAA
jgi:flagellar biosynthesis regulator FlaF